MRCLDSTLDLTLGFGGHLTLFELINIRGKVYEYHFLGVRLGGQ